MGKFSPIIGDQNTLVKKLLYYYYYIKCYYCYTTVAVTIQKIMVATTTTTTNAATTTTNITLQLPQNYYYYYQSRGRFRLKQCLPLQFHELLLHADVERFLLRLPLSLLLMFVKKTNFSGVFCVVVGLVTRFRYCEMKEEKKQGL